MGKEWHMDDGELPFFRFENPAGNCQIILTLQQVKPLKHELDFFLQTQRFHHSVCLPINRCGPVAAIPHPAPKHALGWNAV
jgi:hypothetical protein